MLKWMDENKGSIGILLAIIPLIWTITQYFIESNNTKKKERFELYHTIIADIANGGRKDKASSQRALIYETRFYPEYFEFTCRELEILKGQFTKNETKEELERTLAFIECKYLN